MKRLPRFKRKIRRKSPRGLPAKGRMCDIADNLWSLIVRARWQNQCAVCGYAACEAHHLVPRQHETTRYELRNGIALCANHHQYDRDLSPHQNAAGWVSWLESQHPSIAEWYFANRIPQRFEGTKNPFYYCELIKSLREHVEPEDFVRIVGQKFSAYLEGASA